MPHAFRLIFWDQIASLRWFQSMYCNEKQTRGNWAAIFVPRFGFLSHPCRLQIHEYLNRKGTSSKHHSKTSHRFNYWLQKWGVPFNEESYSALGDACEHPRPVDNESIKNSPSMVGEPSAAESHWKCIQWLHAWRSVPRKKGSEIKEI